MKRLMAAVVASLVGVGIIFSAPPAMADDDGPTIRELLDECDDGTDYCEFRPDGPAELFTTDSKMVGDEVYNCTSSDQNMTVEWSDTTSQSNSVGVSLRTEVGFGKIFAVAYEQSYNRTWTNEHTESQSTSVSTEPGEVGWVERRAQMQRIEGTYEMHFEDAFYGHYVWYVPFTVEGPVPDATEEVITQNVRDMTDAELEQCS